MKQKMLLTLFAILFSMSLQSQIIYMDYDESSPRSQAAPEDVPFIPLLGVTHDQYAPLPDGVLLLGLLGAGYWKRKTKNGKLKIDK